MYIPNAREVVRARNREAIYFVLTVSLEQESVYLVELNSGGHTEFIRFDEILPLNESRQAELVSC